MFFTKESFPHLSGGTDGNKDKLRGTTDKKADLKLDHVVDIYKFALGGYVSSTESSFLRKKIKFDGLRFVNYLGLKYRVENRLWAKSYDLIYSTVFDNADERIQKFFKEDNTTLNSMPDDAEMGYAADGRAFTAKLDGRIKISDVKFVKEADRECVLNDDRTNSMLPKLNDPLITYRIAALDLTDFRIAYKKASCQWIVSCKSLIGSTTWSLIPPVTYLVKPKEKECVNMIELFELIGCVLKRS